jgi:hypothetical protein
VARHAGCEGRQRSDIDDRPAPPLDHARDDAVAEAAGVDHQGHQEIPLPIPGHVREALGDGEARIVDQGVDHPTPRRHRRQHRHMRLKYGQVRRDREGLNAMRRGELRAQRLQPIRPPGHQRQVVAPRGIGPGERRADPR